MSPRKQAGTFDSVIEAEIAKSLLESQGIPCTIENKYLGSAMPHAIHSFGGVSISVEEEDEHLAKQILADNQAPAENTASSFNSLMKRATYGAVIGFLFFPVFANLFSISLYFKAYRMNRDFFWKNRGLLVLGLVFNLIGIFLMPALLFKLFLNPL